MMEASILPQDTGLTSPETDGLLDTSIPLSSPLSPPSPPSKLPDQPCRPKPQLPSRPSLLPSTPPSLPPPLPPVSKPHPPLSANSPPPSLPPPLSPTPVSPPPPPPDPPSEPSPTPSDLPLSSSPGPPQPPAPPTPSPSVSPSLAPTPPLSIPSICPASPPMSPVDRLAGSTSVWKLKGISQDQTISKLEKEAAGAFLVHSKDSEAMTLSVRLPDEQGPPIVHNLAVKQHKTYLHLDGSSLVFDDIIKLVSFYCVSRDILTVRLRLPIAIATATAREELDVISAAGADFWTSELNQKGENHGTVLEQDSWYLYVNAVALEEESPNKDEKNSSLSKVDVISNQDSTTSSLLQNGETTQTEKAEEKPLIKTKTNQEIKYKRPPPRPPSLSTASGSGMGLLFSSSSSSPHTTSCVNPAVVRKEEGKGGGVGGDREERKLVSTSPLPSRPRQSRPAPPLPPAPVRRAASRKSSKREAGEGTEKEKGQSPAGKTERGGGGVERVEEKIGSKSGLLSEDTQQENSGQKQVEDKEDKTDSEKTGKENEKVDKEVKKNKEGDTKKASVKRPSRPVPPPRRKPCSPDSPGGPNQTGAVLANQNASVRIPPPSPAHRPDVSLYSPQGGAVMAADLDSCSSSSAEEDGDVNLEHEQNHSRPAADHRSPRAAVRRRPTTVMLDQARRISTVLTGLISHDRRLTQRIVELARDPGSYFGNLVKEHRAFTLETMSNHTSSTELLQEIRQMMTQLKSYLLQSAELQAMLEPQHQYAQDKLESMVEAALCKSVLKPIRDPIYRCLEKLHTNDDSLKQLTQNQSSVLGSTTTALGVTTSVPETSSMEKISLKLNKLHLEYSPQRKIELLLKACKIIYDSMSVSCPGRAHGADDFLPVMMYVLARSNLSALQMDVEYMMELMDPSLTIGEGSYYLTTTYGALEHIKTFDQQRSATRQLSREVQDSIHRWERRRTLNQERMAQGSVRDFMTVCCPEIGINPKTLGVLPTTTIKQLAEQCAARFEQDCCTLSVYIDGVQQPLVSTDLALSVKSSCQPGAYCFVYHPINQPPSRPPGRTCPTAPPPAPPVESIPAAEKAAMEPETEEEEESLISL